MEKRVSDMEAQEFQGFIRQWVLKKMRKQEKKLRKYAKLYFGEPVTIIYAKDGTKVTRSDGVKGVTKAQEVN